MKAMRNMVAHGYGKMDRRIIWETVTTDIPALKAFLRGTIEHLRLFCNTENRNVFSTRGRHRQEMISLNEQYVSQRCDFGCNLSRYLID